MLERRANPVGRAATANIPRISLGGLRLAVLDIEQTANFMIDTVFPERRVGRPLYLTSANGEVLARCSTEPMTGRLFRAADLMLVNKADLLPYVRFDVEAAIDFARRVRPGLEAILVSAETGQGFDAWLAWLERGVAAARTRRDENLELLRRRIVQLEAELAHRTVSPVAGA